MHFIKKKIKEKRKDFVKKIKTGNILRVPGAYNPLTAKLIEEIGYDAVYVSGGVMSNDLGLPDIGLTSLEQVSHRSGQISRVTDLPTIVDIDTGFGSIAITVGGGTGVYTYEWTASLADGTTTWENGDDIDGLFAGTYTVIATDQSGSTTSEQVSFQVNGLPTTPTVSISPSFAMTMDDLSVNITNPSIDPEGNSVSYSYQWFKNNIIQRN